MKRYNERNIGTYSLDSGVKARKTRKAKISPSEIAFAKAVLEQVYNSLEFDQELSEHGHLHNDSRWTDGGRFTICLTGAQKDLLSDILYDRKF